MEVFYKLSFQNAVVTDYNFYYVCLGDFKFIQPFYCRKCSLQKNVLQKMYQWEDNGKMDEY